MSNTTPFLPDNFNEFSDFTPLSLSNYLRRIPLLLDDTPSRDLEFTAFTTPNNALFQTPDKELIYSPLDHQIVLPSPQTSIKIVNMAEDKKNVFPEHPLTIDELIFYKDKYLKNVKTSDIHYTGEDSVTAKIFV